MFIYTIFDYNQNPPNSLNNRVEKNQTQKRKKQQKKSMIRLEEEEDGDIKHVPIGWVRIFGSVDFVSTFIYKHVILGLSDYDIVDIDTTALLCCFNLGFIYI